MLRIFFRNGSIALQQALFLIFILSGALEALHGLLQLYGFETSNHNTFKVTGSFFNPGPYSGYLICSFPLALACYLGLTDSNISHRLLRHAALSAVLLLLMILPSTMSRAAWLAALLGTAMVYGYQYQDPIKAYLKRIFHKRLNRVLGIALLFVVTAGGAAGLFHLKKDSALGRLLIYEISYYTWLNDPVFGVGSNKYRPAFGKEQIQYFREADRDHDQEMVAGHGEYAFNELLLILVEKGLVGLLLFLGVIASVVVSSISNLCEREPGWTRAAILGVISCLAAILTFSLFSYPFSIPAISLNFYFLIAVLAAYGKGKMIVSLSKYSRLISVLLFIVCLLLSGWILRTQYRAWQINRLWGEATALEKVGAYEQAAEEMAPLAEELKFNGGFLFHYGQVLRLAGHCKQAIDILKRADKFTTDPYLFNSLGICYQELGQYQKAEEAYYQSHYLIPHKFYPLYLLAKLYEESGQTGKSKEMATKLLSKPVKISSPAIEEMKAEMQGILDRDE